MNRPTPFVGPQDNEYTHVPIDLRAETPTAEGYTAFMYAADNGHFDVVLLFLDRGGDPDAANGSHRVFEGFSEPPAGWSALMDAAQGGHIEVVRLLLDRGADLTKGVEKDGHVAIFEAARKGHSKVVQLLLSRGADPNTARTTDGLTPLMAAAAQGSLCCVRVLLEAGADIHQETTKQGTALLAASYSAEVEVVRLLLDKGASVHATDSNGYTALLFVAQSRVEGRHCEVARMLLDTGADPSVVTAPSATEDGEVDHAGNVFPLICAAGRGRLELVRLLLDRGADPNQLSEIGATALMEACGEGHPEVVELLLDRGANPNQAATDRVTALEEAGSTPAASLEIVPMLVCYGADCTAVTSNGRGLIDVATMMGQDATAEWLVQIHGKSPFEVAVACRNPGPIRAALRYGWVDPVPGLRIEGRTFAYTFAQLMATTAAPADSWWAGSPPPCAATTALVHDALAGWAPARHFLFHPGVRGAVRTVLLVSERLQRQLQQRRAKLPELPVELWMLVIGFFLRGSWPVPLTQH